MLFCHHNDIIMQQDYLVPEYKIVLSILKQYKIFLHFICYKKYMVSSKLTCLNNVITRSVS